MHRLSFLKNYAPVSAFNNQKLKQVYLKHLLSYQILTNEPNCILETLNFYLKTFNQPPKLDILQFIVVWDGNSRELIAVDLLRMILRMSPTKNCITGNVGRGDQDKYTRRSLLHWAVIFDKIEIARKIVFSCDVEILFMKDREGLRPVDYARNSKGMLDVFNEARFTARTVTLIRQMQDKVNLEKKIALAKQDLYLMKQVLEKPVVAYMKSVVDMEKKSLALSSKFSTLLPRNKSEFVYRRSVSRPHTRNLINSVDVRPVKYEDNLKFSKTPTFNRFLAPVAKPPQLKRAFGSFIQKTDYDRMSTRDSWKICMGRMFDMLSEQKVESYRKEVCHISEIQLLEIPEIEFGDSDLDSSDFKQRWSKTSNVSRLSRVRTPRGSML